MSQSRLAAPEAPNLLKSAEAIGTAPWVAFNTIVTAGYAAPDGSQAAVLVYENQEVHQHDVHQVFGPAIGGAVYSLSCFCKAGSRKWVRLVLWDHGTANSGGQAWFDLARGPVGTSQLFGNGAAHLDTSMVACGDGWYRCELSCRLSRVSATGTYTAQIQIASHDANVAHTGDGSSGILLWAPHVGRVGTVAIAQRTQANLISYSNAIGKLPWEPQGTSIGEGYASPDGDFAATLLREDAENGEHDVRQIVADVMPGQSYTFSCFCKASARNWVRLVIWDHGASNSGASAWFDLARGILGTASLFGETTSDLVCWMEGVGNGWYRCVMTCVVSDSEAARGYLAQIQIAPTDRVSHYAGDGGSGILVWGAQLEQRRTARPLLPTDDVVADSAVAVLPTAGTNPHWLRRTADTHHEILSYGHNRGGLNNQKMALLGMFLTARRTGVRRVILPEFFSTDPNRFSGRALPFDSVFDMSRLRDFAAGYGIEIVPDAPVDEEGGWDYFNIASRYLSHNMSARNLGPDDFACDFLRAMEPRIGQSDLARRIRGQVFSDRGVQVVLQLRVEIDWVRYASTSLVPTYSAIEEVELSFASIIRKTREGLPASETGIYITSDEAYLPFGKTVIADVTRKDLGIDLIFKSDLLTSDEQRALTRLEMSLLDFEMAVSAPFYVGQSRSTFSNLVGLERFARRRSPISNHYIYNIKGPALGQRTDNGAYGVPEVVIARPKL